MKKIALSFVLFISLIGASFAENFFAHRFFEIKVDVPVNVSNNLVALKDVLQETAIIDLREIANNVSLDGASIKANAFPTFGLKLDIPRGLILGLSVGAQADVGVGLSKDLFEFLGKGNVDMGNDFEMSASNTYADVFATATLNGGWNFKKSKLEISATAFSSIAHFDATDTTARIYMDNENNTTGFEANVSAKGYTAVNTEDMSNVNAIPAVVLGMVYDFLPFMIMPVYNSLVKIDDSIIDAAGDLGAKYQRDLFRFLSVGASIQMPLVPSRLNIGYTVDYNYKKEFNLDQMIGKEGSSSGESGSSTEVPKEEESDEDDDSFLGKPVVLETPYAIHRPLKLGISADFHPFGTLLSTSGYLGIAVRHPFASAINKSNGGANETQFYVDYSIAGRLSLWNVLSLSLSHSYMDQIFKNELAVALNIRLVEVDAGVSFQSPTFTQSFTGSGIGAFVTVCVGF